MLIRENSRGRGLRTLLLPHLKRAGAMIGIADRISSNADLSLKAAKLFAEHGKAVLPHLPQIGSRASESEAE